MTGRADDPRIRIADLPSDAWDDATRGRVSWKTVLSAERSGSHGVVCGIASFPPGGCLRPHRHAQPEAFVVLAGSGTVQYGDRTLAIDAETALFVPGDTVHGFRAGAEGLRMLYLFPADRFSEIAYDFDVGGS